jgi:cobalamin biosynthetic protein CobC
MKLGLENPAVAVTDHGGDLARADIVFPAAPKPWLDLSTGINPHSYPLFDLPATAFSRLPDPSRIAELAVLAGELYGAPGPAHVVAAPGSQILLPMIMALLPPGCVRVLAPTYAEHGRAAVLAGHRVEEVVDFEALFDADIAVVVNPNNPDGRLLPRARLRDLARHMAAKGGLLLVDEAFMDVAPSAESVAGDVAAGGLIVLRSFGKFFGLAGLRLGFALAAMDVTAALSARLGPWAVAGPALDYGLRALADREWQAGMRATLQREAARLDSVLTGNGIEIAGGSSLFRFARLAEAQSLFEALGARGIWVRRFAALPDALRFGLPGGEEGFARLTEALENWRRNR